MSIDLSKFINRDFNINHIEDYIKEKTESQIVLLYSYEIGKYNLIKKNDYSNLKIIYTDFLEDYKIINNSEDIYKYFKVTDRLNNMMLIPIKNSHPLGLLCLLNNPNGYNEHYLDKIGSIFTILQLLLEKTITKYSEKDLFLANMSHEIRTPLNGVIGYNQLLYHTELSNTQKTYLDSMNQCSVQLLQIINDILDFAKISSGKMTINNECFALKDLEIMVMNAISQRIKNKEQSIKVFFDTNCKQNIIADKSKILQILINLISNANKFTHISGEINVFFSTIEDILYVKVEDNGIGINEQDQKRIFYAFEQVENNYVANGSGLGLAISKKLTKLLGGNLTVKSEYNKGSTFTMSVNFINNEDYTKNIETSMFKNKLILIIDNNDTTNLINYLRELETKVITCKSSLEGLRMILGNKYSFDLTFIDICLEGNANHLAKQIKEEKPFFPIVALSDMNSFINTNHFEYKIDKPVDKHTLISILHKIFTSDKITNCFLGEKISYPFPSNSSCDMFNKNVKILITEDIQYNRNLLDTMLQNLGYTNIDLSDNGVDAIKLIENSHSSNDPYEILLLDLRMPKIDGFEVIEIYKEKGWILPRIVVITASIMDEDKKKCKQLGVNFFLHKPIELNKLKEVMLHVSQLLK
ncbi:MAG: hypothetical protein CBD97_01935 [Pelagibacteraceae bacterium TMED237]|nr:MAG: hypothetical protein CBD97_01935 [Pelagibacteraceae bacterium TMED237]|tara:strand:- start:5668 stop:7590 length:1923 start_codon:yes stop_codon:yes gene_type:complete